MIDSDFLVVKYLAMKILFTLLFFYSCSTPKNQILFNDKQAPEWIGNSKGVDDKSLCASGYGTSFNEADAKAKTELASIFRTKIESELKVTQSVNNLQQKMSTDQLFLQSINGVFDGFKITQRYQNPNGYYALGCIDKNIGQENLGKKIETIDQSLAEYKKYKSPWLVPVAQNYLTERKEFESAMMILGGSAMIPPVDGDDVLTWRSQLKELIVFMDFGEDFPDDVQNTLSAIVAEGGAQLTDDLKAANKRIKASYSLKKNYIKVKGFDQYTVQLTLTSYNLAGIQLGKFANDYSVNARDEEQVYPKIKEELSKSIRLNMHKLKLGDK